ncbi:MAG: enoyl-CoA hydratase-related protein, partial [Acidobacteriota bacterium]
MSEYQRLTIQVQDQVALVTIDRSERLNCLDEATLEELETVFSGRLEQEDVRAVIVTGAGDKAFIAGVDIKELEPLDPLGARMMSRRGHRIMERIERFPKPVIAAINGFCLGGGCELALACHLRLASENAQIGLPEVKLGLIPGYGGTQRLPRLVGKGRAMEMILSGESIGAQEALRIGLVNQVVAADQLISRCHEVAGKILQNGPLAVRYAIEVMN